jgi:hypothetical protein
MPENLALAIGDTLVKYSDSILVKIGTTRITYITFYEWLGSTPSLEYFEFTSQEPDDGGGTLVAEIDPLSDYTTTDIVNKINEVITAIS